MWRSMQRAEHAMHNVILSRVKHAQTDTQVHVHSTQLVTHDLFAILSSL